MMQAMLFEGVAFPASPGSIFWFSCQKSNMLKKMHVFKYVENAPSLNMATAQTNTGSLSSNMSRPSPDASKIKLE